MTKICVICRKDVKNRGPGTRGLNHTYTAYQSEILVYAKGLPDKPIHTNPIQYVCSVCDHIRCNAEIAQELENAMERMKND